MQQKSTTKKVAKKGEVFDVLERKVASDGTVVEVIAIKQLSGSGDVRTARNMFYTKEAGMMLKMVRITLKDSHIRLEPGALYYMKGKLEMKATTGGGIMKGLTRKLFSGESFFVNEIHGGGVVYLEPTFGHFILYEIKQGEKGIITDKGMFYAGTAGLNIGAAMQKNLSSMGFGGEGLFQTKIEGSGIAVLYSPVPMSEIEKIELKTGDKLYVDGNFALLRSIGINFRVQKSTKGILSSLVSGEGLLQTFEGVGNVWIAPTQGVYEKLAIESGLKSLARVPGSMGTKTKTTQK